MKDGVKIVLLSILFVIIVALAGLGIGYYSYKSSDKKDNKVEEKIDDTKTEETKTTSKEYQQSELEKSLNLGFPYVIKENIKKADGTVTGYVICKLDEEYYNNYDHVVCIKYKYHAISNNKETEEYDDISNLDDKYIVGSCENCNNDSTKCDLFDIANGNYVKSFDYYTIRSEKMNSNYYSGVYYEDMRELLDKNFNSVIKEFRSYAYVFNKDNTITILPYSEKVSKKCNTTLPMKFYIYDLNGNKLYESKEYDHIIGIGKDEKTGYGIGDLLVENNGSISIMDYKENIAKTLVPDLKNDAICTVTDEQRVYSSYYFYLDDGMYTYNRDTDTLEKE